MCYCGSSINYSDCCQPLHKGEQFAPTALKLMKSRFAAYASKEIQYLVETTHESLEPVYEDLEAWANATTWKKLEVVSSSNGLKHNDTGEVEFKAFFLDQNGSPQVHHEKSQFKKENNKWFYSAGEINPSLQKEVKHTIGRNDPCPCGSGKKHKKCCG